MPDHEWREAVAAPTKTKSQHVVPRFWLSWFARGETIEAFDLDRQSTFEASVKNVAVFGQFYDFALEDAELSAEDWLASVEGEAKPIMDRLRDDPEQLRKLSQPEENVLARFIAAQILRSPTQRSQEHSIRRQMVDQVKEIGKAWLFKNHPKAEADEIWSHWETKPDEFFLHEGTPHQPATTTASMLGETQGFANVLKAMLAHRKDSGRIGEH